MGDLRDWSPERNGAAAEDRPSSSSPSPEDRAAAIGAEYWKRAEDATQGIIAQVQPTVVSEKRRRTVIDFVQRLIKRYLGCEVFPFGSVPLKTYLPDGDIDLTAFGGLNVEEALASDVFSVLEREELNSAAEFVVKDVQLIRAEVKLVKCLVQNIVVDISFNQLGGLCTLCFLEKVDNFIGKDHLFKRSIILIKAWCYYESRILGAHHGLISTYALETLVLYIFHLFNSSLNGPLAVLYKFLDYFSSFDWDNYCISLNGPVRISSLPELLAEAPENGGHELFLSDDLKEGVDSFSVPSRGYETSSRTFPPKHLNIVDPLKENNNLGRSVSKGNFFRIRSAFSYGARKLRRILSQPEENIANEIRNFFSNTMERHGKGQRPDVQDAFHMSGYDELGAIPTSLDAESQEIQTFHEADSSYSSHVTGERSLPHRGSLNGRVTNVEISETEGVSDRLVNETYEIYMNGNAISDNRIKGDAKDLATNRLQNLTISNDSPKLPTTSGGANRLSPLGKAYHSPHLYSAHSSIGNGEMNGNEHMQNTEGNDSSEITASDQDENQLVHNRNGSPVAPKPQLSRMSSIVLSSEDFYPRHSGYGSSTAVCGSTETCSTLSDLSGDFESHVKSLQYGRRCYDYASTPHFPSMPPMLPPNQGEKSWELIRRSLQYKQPMFSHVNANGIVPRPTLYHISPPLIPGGAGFSVEEMPKPRGTGTYFPNMNHYRDRPVTPRGKNQASLRSPRSNGRLATLTTENGFPERSVRDATQAPISLPKESGKSVSSDEPYGSPRRKADSNANCSLHLPEHFVEFGSLGHLPPEQPLLRGSWPTSIYSAPIQNLSVSDALQGTENLKPPALVLDKDRIAVQSYRLKDEDDFPPLSI